MALSSSHVLVLEEDGEESPMSMSAQEVIVPVDGVKILTLVLASVVWIVMMVNFAPLQPSSLMVQVIRECVVEQEDTRKETRLLFLSQSIDSYYTNGLSITHGNPRQHIWTYANGQYDGVADHWDFQNCPCAPGSELSSPSFVGANYYCESGTNNTYSNAVYYLNDPLWDGSGCITSTCCNNPNLPWFYKDLNRTTTDDIEVRICSHQIFLYGTTLIDQLELYIQ